MEYVFLSMYVLCVVYQAPHTYALMNEVNMLVPEKWNLGSKEYSVGKTQNLVLVVIFSFMIGVFVYMRFHIIAGAFVFFEVAINTYLNNIRYFRKYKHQGSKRSPERKLIEPGSYILGIIMPLCIAGFSYLYVEYDNIVQPQEPQKTEIVQDKKEG